MDAVTLLRNDHKVVNDLFKRFEKLGDSATTTKRQVADKIIHELSVHAAVEEQLFYPTIRKEVRDKKVQEMVLESLEEHHVVKWLLSELEDLNPGNERFDPKMTVLMESVRHHVKEEEGDLFPKVRDAMGRKELQELGAAMEKAKKVAPTRPHPRAPDSPPGNLVAGPAAALTDRAREVGKRVIGRRAS